LRLAIIDLGNLLVLGKVRLLHDGEVLRPRRLPILPQGEGQPPELARQPNGSGRVSLDYLKGLRRFRLGVKLPNTKVGECNLLDYQDFNGIGWIAGSLDQPIAIDLPPHCSRGIAGGDSGGQGSGEDVAPYDRCFLCGLGNCDPLPGRGARLKLGVFSWKRRSLIC